MVTSGATAGADAGARRATTEVWHNVRGDAFRLVRWTSPRPARTVVLVHHGLGEHAGRYDTVARAFADDPVEVWGFDARGHGLSVGRRGDVDGLAQLAEDLETVLPVIRQRAGADRTVLLGHSMGAAATLWYLVSRVVDPAIAAVMLSAPPVVVQRTPRLRAKAALARVARRVAPRLVLGNGLDPSDISSVPEEVERYRRDPLVHDRISARLGWSLLHDAPGLPARAARVTLPTLLWHGADDRIALPEGSAALAKVLPSVEHVVFAGARHEVHHERPETRADLFERIRAFTARVAGA